MPLVTVDGKLTLRCVNEHEGPNPMRRLARDNRSDMLGAFVDPWFPSQWSTPVRIFLCEECGYVELYSENVNPVPRPPRPPPKPPRDVPPPVPEKRRREPWFVWALPVVLVLVFAAAVLAELLPR